MSEALLATQLIAAGLPAPEREFRFHPERDWRADFAWPTHGLLVEFEGGTWARGRHSRGRGFAEDCEKYNAAGLMGYLVLRFTGKHVRSGEAVRMIEKAIAS